MFEAELAIAMFAILKAYYMRWDNIWLESDSIYVMYVLRSANPSITWRFVASWSRLSSIRTHID